MASLFLAAALLAGVAQARDVTVEVEGEALPGFAEGGVTYVQLTPFLEALGEWETQWDGDTRTATAETELFTLAVPIQRSFVLADGYPYETGRDSLLVSGRTYVPLRSVANLLGAQVEFIDWDTPVTVVPVGMADYTEEDLYWLSRIISAESQGESLAGQIAVGNVVCNRVQDSQFPDTIRGVIFDRNNGVQFEPVSNGTVYNEPSNQSILAAHLALNGVNTAGGSLYFFNPALSQGQWVRQNRAYYGTIGCHMFYM